VAAPSVHAVRLRRLPAREYAEPTPNVVASVYVRWWIQRQIHPGRERLVQVHPRTSPPYGGPMPGCESVRRLSADGSSRARGRYGSE